MKKYRLSVSAAALLASLLLNGCMTPPYTPDLQSASPSGKPERPSPEATTYSSPSVPPDSNSRVTGYDSRDDCAKIVAESPGGGSIALPQKCFPCLDYSTGTPLPSPKKECAVDRIRQVQKVGEADAREILRLEQGSLTRLSPQDPDYKVVQAELEAAKAYVERQYGTGKARGY